MVFHSLVVEGAVGDRGPLYLGLSKIMKGGEANPVLWLPCPSFGPVVQSILSLMSSLRGQLVKCFTTLLLNTLIFFVEKMRKAFALQKLFTLFQQKILANSRY